MTFFCISDRESSIGFKLSGIEVREVSGESETKKAMSDALSRKDIGVILITEKVLPFVKKEFEELVYSAHIPLVLEIPSRGKAEKEISVREFLKKAVGISI